MGYRVAGGGSWPAGRPPPAAAASAQEEPEPLSAPVLPRLGRLGGCEITLQVLAAGEGRHAPEPERIDVPRVQLERVREVVERQAEPPRGDNLPGAAAWSTRPSPAAPSAAVGCVTSLLRTWTARRP